MTIVTYALMARLHQLRARLVGTPVRIMTLGSWNPAEPPVVTVSDATWVGPGKRSEPVGLRQPDPIEVPAPCFHGKCRRGQPGWLPSQPRPRRPAGIAAVGWKETANALVHGRGAWCTAEELVDVRLGALPSCASPLR